MDSMTEEPIPTTDHEHTVMAVMLALSIAWPFFHPFHSTHATVIYWAGVAVMFICAALLAVGAILRSRAARTEGRV
jgi:hypothetical protein